MMTKLTREQRAQQEAKIKVEVKKLPKRTAASVLREQDRARKAAAPK